MQNGPKLIIDFLEECLSFVLWHLGQETTPEHFDPMAEARLSFQRCRAVKQRGKGDFQAVQFQKRSIMPNAGIVPRRVRRSIPHRLQRLAHTSEKLLDVALSTQLGHKPTTRLQRT